MTGGERRRRPTSDDLALLTVAEVASLLHVGEAFVYDEIRSGHLRGFPWPRPKPSDLPLGPRRASSILLVIEHTCYQSPVSHTS